MLGDLVLPFLFQAPSVFNRTNLFWGLGFPTKDEEPKKASWPFFGCWKLTKQVMSSFTFRPY